MGAFFQFARDLVEGQAAIRKAEAGDPSDFDAMLARFRDQYSGRSAVEEAEAVRAAVHQMPADNVARLCAYDHGRVLPWNAGEGEI